MSIANIRNFCIIAHIDHGKSTLADRILELTGAMPAREQRQQFLDANIIEQERGITIKAKAVTLTYTYEGSRYQLNLIDTPGHVDFAYEVSRSLAACEGALLVVDATQGVQAQTIANAYLALEGNLTIVPIINKIDSPLARPAEVAEEMRTTLGIKPEEIIQVSAKTGQNVEQVLEAIVKRIPPPAAVPSAPLQALIFDSVYDFYRGVIVYVRVMNGRIAPGKKIRLLHSARVFEVEEVGKFKPRLGEPCAMNAEPQLDAGEVGYVIAGIKNIHDVKIGDTITDKDAENVKPLPGYKEPLPMVFCGIYPTGDSDYNSVKKAIERLSLNDSAFVFEPETSEALGFGLRCGFLGLLHMDIFQERLEREEQVEVIRTAPNVTYEVIVREKGGTVKLQIDNPAKLPDEEKIIELREPIARTNLIVPAENVGIIMQLCEDRRGTYVRTEYLSPSRVILTYDLPFAEMVYDFYDKMKSATRGYGTMDYHIIGFQASNLVRLRILVGGQEVDALSTIVHRDQAEQKGRKIIQILRKEIPRHMFEVPLQAAIGKRIIARETIKAIFKNVTAKCYGGDITRKRKLLEKQREGKKKMKAVGSVQIPQKAFMAVLSAGK